MILKILVIVVQLALIKSRVGIARPTSISLEQLLKEEISPQGDLYSLGATFTVTNF